MDLGNEREIDKLKIVENMAATASNSLYYRPLFEVKGGVVVRQPGQISAVKKRTRHRSHSCDDRHSHLSRSQSLRRGVASDSMLSKLELITKGDPEAVYSRFMQAYICYDVIPTSSKLLVFDTQLRVKKAFYALVYNGVRAAPLWDSAQKDFIGMLTITDFIMILKKYYKHPLQRMDELEEHKIDTWRQELKHKYKSLASIKPTDTLYDAVKVLTLSKVHRLPVVDDDTGDVMHILTHKRLLKFLYLYIHDIPQPDFMTKSIQQLNVGTFDNIATVKSDTPVIQALRLFVTRRVSALPVVDSDGRPVDIYAKFDVINLAAERTYDNLDITVETALRYRRNVRESVHHCKLTHSLTNVVETIVRAEVHRLVVIDEDERVCGVISLSDILSYLVLKSDPPVEDTAPTSQNQSFDLGSSEGESTPKGAQTSDEYHTPEMATTPEIPTPVDERVHEDRHTRL